MTGTVLDVLNLARAQLQTVESPPNSNNTKYGIWFGFNKVPWCAIAESWVYAHCGLADQYRFASVAASLDWARKNGKRTNDFRPGYSACRINDGGDWGPGHTGIVEAEQGDYVITLEGNTSPGSAGSQRDGGGYFRRKRLKSYWNKQCIRIDFKNVPQPPPPAPTPAGGLVVDGDFGPNTVKALQRRLNETEPGNDLGVDGDMAQTVSNKTVTFRGVKTNTGRYLQQRLNWATGPVGIDGDVGQQTIRALQRYVGVGQDGEWGSNTTSALQRKLNTGTF